MRLEEIIKELGSELGQKLVLSPLGACQFVFNACVLKLERGGRPGTFFLFAIVDILQQDDPEYYTTLLEANLFGSKSGNASFGINLENNAIILFQEFQETSLKPQDFKNSLGSFLSYLTYWQKHSAQQKVRDPSSYFITGPSMTMSIGKGLHNLNFI